MAKWRDEREESKLKKSDVPLTLSKKKTRKSEKTAVPVYMELDLIEELTEVAVKGGYSRNELINIMLEYALDNLKLQD